MRVFLRYTSAVRLPINGFPKLYSTVHPKLLKLVNREVREEGLRDFLPPRPVVPYGWQLHHIQGTNRFDLTKSCEIRGCGEEHLHAIGFMEQKQYEGTYRMDNGEREEQEFLNFHLFIKKSGYKHGGLEFGLTSIDLELVIDSLCIHKSNKNFNLALDSLGTSTALQSKCARKMRDNAFRGPMLNELDDDLSDDILDYLDERGINNAFAEYMLSQAHFLEQSSYLYWLKLLKRFAVRE